MYRDPELDEKPKLLEERGGALVLRGRGDAASSRSRPNRGDVQIVNVRNAGAIPNIDAGAVVEVPCRIDALRRRAAAAAPASCPRCSAWSSR